MSRKAQIQIKKILPFTTSQFLLLKNRVKTQIVQKQKYRCGNDFPQFKFEVLRRSISQAPSSLQQQTYSIKSKKKYSSIDPVIKVKKPNFGQSWQVKQAMTNIVQVQKFNPQRFRKIIHLQQNHLCRTCEVDKRYRPKLFKKRF